MSPPWGNFVIECNSRTNDLEPMLRFWQQDVGLRFDHVLPVRCEQTSSHPHPVHPH
jgi:lactoylglutathione lyase